MVSLPSVRQLALFSLLLLLLVLSLTIFYPFSSRATHTARTQLLASSVQHGTRIDRLGPQDASPRSKVASKQEDYFTYAPPPPTNPHLAPLPHCPDERDKHTHHIRLTDTILYNISLTPQEDDGANDRRQFFNPAILPLPASSGHARYVLISRVVTPGLHQESLICLADLCLPSTSKTATHLPTDSRPCDSSDHNVLGPDGGLRCTTKAIKINIPPTPARQCHGAWTTFPDIPGFHDPRIFWSGKGEPLIIVNSASQYGCVGLWVVDLRTLFPELRQLLHAKQDSKNDESLNPPPLVSYPHLTEITRNPRASRAGVEKNWILFFPTKDEAYVQYDMLGPSPTLPHMDSVLSSNAGPGNLSRRNDDSPATDETLSVGGRSFAKLLNNGFTTPNLASASERPCFESSSSLSLKSGKWHQGSNALRLVLCDRSSGSDSSCASIPEDELIRQGRVVHFAIMHRKYGNEWDLPLRYERYLVVWEARRPFRVVGVSRSPLLIGGETPRFSVEEQEMWKDNKREEQAWMNKDGNGNGNGTTCLHINHARDSTVNASTAAVNTSPDHERKFTTGSQQQHLSAYFTYSPSLAWAWRPRSHLAGSDAEHDDVSNLGTGFLSDSVLIGVGIDDRAQMFAKIEARRLLSCLTLCPGVDV